MEKSYPVFKKTLAMKLIQSGGVLLGVERNKHEERFMVFHFRDDAAFRKILTETTKK